MTPSGKHVVVAVLDWGLGHASRCIPVIRALLHHQCQVTIAGSGPALQLLQIEFPALQTFALPAYNPVYPSGKAMVWRMATQLPKFLRVIRSEHLALEHFVIKHDVNLVISDNRFGCWSARVPSVFITHQRTIPMPDSFGWLSPFVRRANNSVMRKFSECWIPDSGPDGLAGDLVTLKGQGPPCRFVGTLSRFTRSAVTLKAEYDVVAVCSGPEPQRMIFESRLRTALDKFPGQYLLVRGVIEDADPVRTPNGIVYNYMTASQLGDVLAKAGVVIARCGYSTVMDMSVLGKKAIFVPTPGQTEQEYLAKRLMEKKIAFSMSQGSFDLMFALQASLGYQGFNERTSGDRDYLSAEIERIIASL